MTRPASRLLPCALALLATSGCAAAASDPRYPSLLPRAIETRSDAEPVALPVVAAPDPATDAKIAALRKTLADTAATFATSAARTERLAMAARGDAVGGERWIAAQTALAELDVLRASIAATLSDIDDLAMTRASEGLPPYPALEALRDDVQAAADAQSARIAAIQARLPDA